MPLRTKTSLVIDELMRVGLMGGLLASAAVAPNAVAALEKPVSKLAKRLDKSIDARKLAYYMKRTNLVEIVELDDDRYEVRLTEKGKKRAAKVAFEQMEIGKPKAWDYRWRVVIYDIPEEHRAHRRFLSEKLKELDFYMLQRSLWVHPFPCLEQIELIKHVIPEIAPHVTLLETDKIDQHNRLIKHFVKILPL